MSIISRIRSALRGLSRSYGGATAEPIPAAEDGDGHAPGHRHLGPPPEQAGPKDIETERTSDQPWVRTSHSDSQKRRFRR